MIKALVQEEVLVHPRNIARIVSPQSQGRTTPPHQDNIYIQGTPDTYSVWMPLMDCPIELGGLCVLEGSHRHGVLPVYKAAGPGGLAADTEGLEQAWRASGFRTGDALFFHSRAVHAAFHNQTADTFRLSIDYRYQGVFGAHHRRWPTAAFRPPRLGTDLRGLGKRGAEVLLEEVAAAGGDGARLVP